MGKRTRVLRFVDIKSEFELQLKLGDASDEV